MAQAQTDRVTGEDGLDDERPSSLTWALRLLVVLVAFGGLTVIAMILRHDDLIRAWAEGHASTRRELETQGIGVFKNVPPGKTRPPAFITPAVTLYCTLTLLLYVLRVFLRNGFEWARISVTVVLLVVMVCSIGAIVTAPPALFIGATCVGFVIAIATIVAMWVPATTRYIHPRSLG